ncbi:hypothetical protein [Streptacidiphilus carbonis]|uniref:hypothetical protein n=1 Tax=Streptacidiphilus carbonis TaxID=105422 RepID=UPI0005AB5A43|nr:hypothetical protein [Streptacidiphilus carbonis]
MDDGGLAIRILRAGVFSALLVVLSATAHILLTGAPLSGDVVGTATALVFAAAMLLAARERTFAQITLLLVPVELALNAFFNVSQETCAPGTGAAPAGLWSTVVCGGGTVSPQLSGPSLAGPHSVVLVTAPLLLAVACAHLLLSVLAAAWLRRGEKALFAVLAAAAAVLAVPLRLLMLVVLPAPEPPTWTPAPRSPDRPGPQDLLLRGLRRRGPPAPAFVNG